MKINKVPFFRSAAVAAMLLIAAAVPARAEIAVSDVVATPLYPWNGLVDVSCKVSGLSDSDSGAMFSVTAVNRDTGAETKAANVRAVRNGEATTSLGVDRNGEWQLVWDARADLGEVKWDNAALRIEIDVLPQPIEENGHRAFQLWEGGPYWSETNIGADNPEDYGLYFWWGDTVGYRRSGSAWVASDGSSQNFAFWDDPISRQTYEKSVSTLLSEGWIVQSNGTYILAPEHDAAHVHWGGAWRMPTISELYDLCYNKCDWMWTTRNGVNGYIVQGRGAFAANSIFLPAAGYGYGASLSRAASLGDYWSSVPSEGNSYAAGSLYFNSDDRDTGDWNGRSTGQSVRPVLELSK